MSHSKFTKRGHSYYVERFNPRAKRFIIECRLCGHTGFTPSVLSPDFASTLEMKAIRETLQSILEPLELDDLGRCPVCAAQQQPHA